VGVTKDTTNLRRGSTLLGQLADLVDDLLGGCLQPCRGSAGVWDGRGRYALSVAVKSTHFELAAELWAVSDGRTVVVEDSRKRQERGSRALRCEMQCGISEADSAAVRAPMAYISPAKNSSAVDQTALQLHSKEPLHTP